MTSTTTVTLLNELNLAIKKMRIAERMFRRRSAAFVRSEIENGQFTTEAGRARKQAVDAFSELRGRTRAVREAWTKLDYHCEGPTNEYEEY